jgi:hypothetical protein
MKDLLDAFWRACATCVHPRVILSSLLPLLLAGGAAGVLGWVYWEAAIDGVRDALEQGALSARLLPWLDEMGANHLRVLLAPLIVVALAVPLVVVVTLLLVAVLMTPAVSRLVVAQRFAGLQARRGAPWWQVLAWTLACALTAVVALALSVPLWLVPPMVLIVPPLIWGWLSAHVLAFDVLAHHAAPNERRFVLRARRWPLWAMGVVCGYLGALPTLLWALSPTMLIFAPLLIAVSVWLHTLVFAFAACWFAHFALTELDRLRRAEARAASGDAGGPSTLLENAP